MTGGAREDKREGERGRRASWVWGAGGGGLGTAQERTSVQVCAARQRVVCGNVAEAGPLGPGWGEGASLLL